MINRTCQFELYNKLNERKSIKKYLDKNLEQIRMFDYRVQDLISDRLKRIALQRDKNEEEYLIDSKNGNILLR